jgi:hypothetical protein
MQKNITSQESGLAAAKQTTYRSGKYSTLKHFIIFPIFLLAFFAISLNGRGQQLIGSFPYMNGGFEGQATGALGTSLSTTLWSRQSQAGSSSSIVTTTPRTGVQYATVTSAATVSRNLQTPQSATASDGPAISTQYVVQFYVLNASSVNSFQAGVTTNGTSNPVYSTAATLSANATWSKQTYILTTTATALSTCGIGIAGRSAAGTFAVDDFVIYAGSAADVTAANSPGSVTVNNATTSSLDVSWGAASGGIDGGGYVVVRYATSPNADNDPNQNGIYAVGNTTTNGTGSLTGTVRYIGTGTSFTDNVGLSAGITYYYKVYTVDKAFNYSAESSGNGTTSSGGTSSSSNIITANNEYSNIPYATKTASSITATSDAIRVWSFTIQDGGGSADADAFGTILNSITIDKGTSNGVTTWATTIKQAALYDGSTEVAEISVTGETMAFTGLFGSNVTAADNGSKTLDLYLTFETTNITDNQQFQFRIQKANTTTDATGSSFSSFSDVTSSVTSDNDRIEVTSTKLLFVQQPSNANINAAMSPNPTVNACDANNNVDLDYVTAVSVASSGSLTGSPVSGTWASNVATFASLTHTASGTGLTLTAASGSLASAVSNTFDIICGATTIASDGLNNSTSVFTLSGGAYYTGNSTGSDGPATSPFAIEGTHSRGVINGTATLTSADINTSGYSSITMSLRVAAFSIGSAANGMDGADIVTVEVSPNGGTNYYSTVRVLGNANAYWAYSTGTGNASTSYDGNASPVDFAPASGGNRTTDGYSTISVTGLPETSNLRIRITLLNNATAEQWVVDDFKITGTGSCGASTVTVGGGSEPATISSLYDTQGEAVLNFDFTVTDDGVTPATDALTTKISQIVIGQGTGNDIADWTQAILGALITDGTTTQTANITINATNITIASIANTGGTDLGYIVDNGNKTYTLKIWLKSSLGGTLPTTIDGLNLVFRVQNSGFTFNGGSDLAASQDQNSGSTNNAIAVAATQLAFVQQPTNTMVNNAMSPNPTVQATDANGNRDLGYSTAISVTSTGTLTGTPVSGTWSSGLATFSSLTHTVVQASRTLTATSSALSATSGNFDITAAPNVFISEVAGYGLVSGTWNNEYIELTNNDASPLSLNGWSLLYYEGTTLEKTITFTASHTIPANDAFVIAVRTSYTAALTPDYVPASGFSINNNFRVILKDNTSAIFDEAGSLSDPFDCDYNYEFTACGNDNKPVANWDNLGATDGTPGVVNCVACITPTVISNTLAFSAVTENSMTLNWSNGNGAKRIVIARAGSAVSFTPTNTTTYTANSVFSDGTDLGSGNICVYNGDASTVALTGLNGYTTYYFAVYEYNCLPSHELYSATALTGSRSTSLSPVTGLQVVCETNTTAEISWTLPTGTYTGVIIGIRNSATLDPHNLLTDASTYNANPIFGSGTQYGTTTPYSFVVYKGTGTSVTVTGLTAGQPYYIKAYAYKNDAGTIVATTLPTTLITSLGVKDVAGQLAVADNAQVLLQWTNPGTSCFDEVMIVANDGAAITNIPSGDGSTYTADLAYGSGDGYHGGYIVYKGTFSPQLVTGLTNGTEYCFTWFVRNGTSWSTGVSACATPANVTILYPGDLAIVAVNTQATSSGSADEICFFAFKDITAGTAIDFTDNGYERANADKWADSEGTIRLYRTGATIPAGQIICFQGAGNSAAGFDMFTCGTPDNAGWTVSSLNSSGPYDLNVDDQIWIMQGGDWDYNGSLNNHDAEYSGNLLYGWTATGWKTNVGTLGPEYWAVSPANGTHGSTLYPEMECFNTDVTVPANHDKVKYVGSTTATSQYEWITRINDDANWLGYANNSAYEAGPDYVGTCITFGISSVITIGSAGVWTGLANEDWFDCKNWQNLRIPTGAVNVSVSGAVANHITIDDGIPSVPQAECNDLTIASSAKVGAADVQLKVNNSASVLNIYGNMANNQIILHTNGNIHYKGNFVNNDTYTHNTAGTAIFDGSDAQSLTGTTAFFNMKMDNSSTGLTIGNDISVNNILTLSDGLINTGTNKVKVENNATTSVIGYSMASYINGILRRKVAATGAYDLPVGTASNYELANINLTTSTIDYLDAKFTSPHSGTALPTSPYLTINNTNLTVLLDYGFWTITPATGTATNYDVTLTSMGHTNGGTQPEQHTIVKRADAAGAWASYQANHNNSTQSGTGTNPITAKLTAMSGFSDFAIARSTLGSLPIELMSFEAKPYNEDVLLEWTTASETNNDYFEVERSYNGIDFNSIGIVKGAGNSSTLKSYSLTDYEPLTGLSYYKLKQIDYNGDFSFSDIVSILINSKENLVVYPIYNPDYAATLLIDNPSKEELYLRITDVSGETIQYEKLDYNNERVIIEIEKGKIPQGIYIFNVFNLNESVTKKMVIL